MIHSETIVSLSQESSKQQALLNLHTLPSNDILAPTSRAPDPTSKRANNLVLRCSSEVLLILPEQLQAHIKDTKALQQPFFDITGKLCGIGL